MIDTHYDLLTICYLCYLKNDYSKIKKIAKEINKSGVTGIFANLYFMSQDEMQKELYMNYYNSKTAILDMFKISTSILEAFLPNIEFLYSIEGCDYLEKDDLESLYLEGLRSILLVWNNKNKYASGNKSDSGLTTDGVSFLNKAIDLGIGIDLSHANDKSFYDMTKLIKERKKDIDVTCFASHSNSRSLRNIKRNLSDDQIITLREIDGCIGVISNKHFVKDPNYREEYVKQIKYISSLIGIDRVMLSTDDMRFNSDYDSKYLKRPIYDYKRLSKDIRSDLTEYFSTEEVDKIMYKNAEKIIRKLKK